MTVLADLDSESTVLCACALDPERLAECVPFLRTEHFFSDANGLVWNALVELRAADASTGLADVFEWLRQHGDLGRVGGAPYLETVLRFQAYSIAAADHARIVRDLYIARETVSALQRAAIEIETAGPSVTVDVVKRLGDRLREVRT